MKKRNKNLTSQNSGITLVALIITIIVLLILAVVAIRAVQGDGIIKHAKNATDTYKVNSEAENQTIIGYKERLDYELGNNAESGKDDENAPQTAATAKLSIGDYINYPVYYDNVDTTNGRKATDEYIGWRILSIERSRK